MGVGDGSGVLDMGRPCRGRYLNLPSGDDVHATGSRGVVELHQPCLQCGGIEAVADGITDGMGDALQTVEPTWRFGASAMVVMDDEMVRLLPLDPAVPAVGVGGHGTGMDERGASADSPSVNSSVPALYVTLALPPKEPESLSCTGCWRHRVILRHRHRRQRW